MVRKGGNKRRGWYLIEKKKICIFQQFIAWKPFFEQKKLGHFIWLMLVKHPEWTNKIQRIKEEATKNRIRPTDLPIAAFSLNN